VLKNITIAIFGILTGILVGYLLFFRSQTKPIIKLPGVFVKQSIGFLPYWLLDKAEKDYSQYLNEICYFGLTIGSDGKLIEFSNPQEKEPGWYALESGRVNSFLEKAKENNQTLSLTVFNGESGSIGDLMSNPIEHADNLISDVGPILKKYGFSDLNLDVEYVGTASEEARMHFTEFVKEIKTRLKDENLATLSIDVSPTIYVKNYLIDPVAISEYVDSIIIMGYDYHFQGSYVTGPVAPLFGANTISEYDIQTAVEKALLISPSSKIILGAPLYGYEWETIGTTPRSPVIPGTGLIASSQRVEELLNKCVNCSVQQDQDALENYIVYKDPDRGSYHQIFYPNRKVMSDKIKFVQKNNLGGIALWALGYEDSDILGPLKDY